MTSLLLLATRPDVLAAGTGALVSVPAARTLPWHLLATRPPRVRAGTGR